MGKKNRKDDKPFEDSFETLAVESRHASTAVLMLTSPEEDVLAKSCEALFRFSEKCDENKVVLLKLDCLDQLLLLAQNEDSLVCRNACMVLASLSENEEVKKKLRTKEECIPLMVKLLGPGENDVIHEFAALCLASLAVDFISKAAIVENGGLAHLVACLSSSDPDIQKNSLEALALILQDIHARSELATLDAFLPLLNLIKSDYVAIQHLALIVLHRSADDAINRAKMQRQHVMHALIEFIAQPEWDDLHVFAIIVLASLLEDKNGILAIQENQGLQKLVAMITDSPQPEESQERRSREKPKSRLGKKKSAGGEDKSRSWNDPRVVITSIPPVKQHAALAIARAARNAENRQLLHEQHVEEMLIKLLSQNDLQVVAASARALGVLAASLSCRNAIGQLGGIEALGRLLKSSDVHAVEMGAFALASSTAAHPDNCTLVMRGKLLDSLVLVLQSCQLHDCLSHIACVISNLAADWKRREELRKHNVIGLLSPLLNSENSHCQRQACLALAALIDDQESRTQFCKCGGPELLVELLQSADTDLCKAAALAVSSILVDANTISQVSKFGGMSVLEELASSSAASCHVEQALDKLLANNLSIKYAATGSVDSTDFIEDGFYDAGRVQRGTAVLPLEDYCSQAINKRRQIILVNAKPERTAESQGTPSPDLRGSRSSKSRRGKSSKEEKFEEVSEKIFQIPSDPELCQQLEKIRAVTRTLESDREKLVAIAKFVSECMGGPIERLEVHSFCWELPINQLKCDLRSNVIPIGKIKAGIFYHRALLFKVMADRLNLPCSLHRGDYNRAWNVVQLSEHSSAPGAPNFPSRPYVIDLMFDPGHFIPQNTPEAIQYQTI